MQILLQGVSLLRESCPGRPAASRIGQAPAGPYIVIAAREGAAGGGRLLSVSPPGAGQFIPAACFLTLRDSPQARDRLLIEGLPIEGGIAAIDRGTDGQVLWDPKRQTYPTIGDVVPVRQICDFSAVHQVIDALQQKCKTLCL